MPWPSIPERLNRKQLLFFFAFTLGSFLCQGQFITLSLKNAPVETAFLAIQSQAHCRVIYSQEMVENLKPLSLEVNKIPLQMALDMLFSRLPLTYSLEEGYILVKEKDSHTATIFHDVSGRITDEKGSPLFGATVAIKGTDKVTSSDAQGEFLLSQVSEKAILLVSSVGYHSVGIPLNGKSRVEVQLTVAVSSLEETVVIAYGSTTKRLNTGSVSNVKSEDIEKQPVSNPLAALEGRVPGMMVSQQTGVPGGAFSVQIRGQNSLRLDGNNPLYIIDGVPFAATSLSTGIGSSIIPFSSPFNSLDPAQIERIEVLKDADATAIYGSRGANGVVLITTKKGKVGKTQVNASVYEGMARVGRRMNLLDTRQYLMMRHEAFQNDGVNPTLGNARDLYQWDTTRYTDWQKTLIGGTGHLTNAQINFSGGNANTQFLVGGGYYRESTVFPGHFSDGKASGHFNLEHTSQNQRFHLLFSGLFVADRNNLPVLDLTTQAISLVPIAPALYDSSGKLNWQHSTWYNPLAYLNQKFKASTDNLISNVALSYQLFPGMHVKTSLGFSKMDLKETETFPKSSYYPDFLAYYNPYSSFGNSSLSSWIIEPQATYQRKLGKGKLSLLAGLTFQESLTESQSLLASGFNNDGLMENIQAATSITVSSFIHNLYHYAAGFGRINYNYKEKYVINLTGRRDGSSRFGTRRQFANFGAAGAAWIFSSEDFIKKTLPFLSYGKLRGSFGITGSDQIPDYGYLDSYSPTAFPYQNINGLIPAGLQNLDYSWETNRKMEGGVELGFLNNQLLISGSYYRNRSSNQLVGFSRPFKKGLSTIQANQPPTVQNTGLELELSWSNAKTHRFHVESALNLTLPRNELIAYPGLASSSYANIYEIGKPLYVKKLYHYTGVDPKTGLYTFEDVNKDGQLNYPNDLMGEKSVETTCYGGFQSSLSYKGFQLDVFFQMVKGTGWNYLSNFYNAPGGRFSNQPAWILDRWQVNGDLTNIEKFTQSPASTAYQAYNNMLASDAIISDVSFIRLKNVQLAFHLPSKWCTKLSLQSGKFFMQGQNLLSLSNYKGFDPETQNAKVLPLLRVLTAGIQLNL
ncbi:MAG: SusC/RagA family TonB-linked outer membrane protein [Flavisolibacter sp.]